MSQSKILFIMTGSIACFKACGIVSKLVQAGHDLKVVATSSALKFVGAATLEGLTGQKVHSDLWEQGTMMDHINLMRWADLVIVAPASSDYINKIANGVGNDLASTLFLAHDFKKPFLLAPAMNTSMYLHPVTQNSIQILKKIGIQILETASGVLACGEVGLGKLLEPEAIISEVQLALSTRPGVNKSSTVDAEKMLKGQNPSPRILITGGGTSVAIDSVRSLTNLSTGETAALIADQLAGLGFEVSFLHAKNSHLPVAQTDLHEFESLEDFSKSFKSLLQTHKFAAVIHAAAVSDFIPDFKVKNKIPSDKNVSLKFKKSPKLVNQIRGLAPKSLVVAFKLTDTKRASEQNLAVKKLLLNSKADLVIHNDRNAMNAQLHPFEIYDKNMKSLSKVDSKPMLAQALGQLIAEKFYDTHT